MRKIFTFLFAALMSVGMFAATEVTITNSDFPMFGTSFTKDGVTVSAGMIDGMDGNLMDGGSFSTTLGNFTKIEVTAMSVSMLSGEGWSGNPQKKTWTGNASSVSFSGDIMGMGMGTTTLKFTIEEPTVAVTGVTLNQNEAQMTVGGETLTLIATVNPDNATDKSVTWSTSDANVATVDNGVVTAVAAGNAIITVTTTDGSFTATCAVTVTAPEPEPEPAGDEITVTWNSADMPSSGNANSFTKDGVTITCGGIGIDWGWKDFQGNGTFTTDLGNFTKIEVTAEYCEMAGEGWSGNSEKMTWTGNASSVSYNGSIMGCLSIVFTIEPASTPEPEPQPAEDVNITPNVDPENPTVYYSTFFDSANKYALPAGVEAYVADLSGANLLLTKIAEAGEVIPANVAVILKATVTPFTLTPSDADAVTFTATNDLQGSDTQIATPANCYVLAGTDGVVGFYHYTAANLNAHKAYVVYSGSNQAPRRMPFIFDQATGVENVQGDNVQSTKVIENGVLYIIKNGVKYNAQGQVVK